MADGSYTHDGVCNKSTVVYGLLYKCCNKSYIGTTQLSIPSKNEQSSTYMTSGRSSNLGGRKLDPIGVVMVDVADPMHSLNTLYNTAESVPTAIP